MKTPHRFPIFPSQPRPAVAGAALVLTLGMLVLLSGLVLAFFLTVRTEHVASKAYEGGTDARLLADSALNLVIGQIREASTQANLAWTSQPGLIRTFDTNGAPVKSYKLYSADSLVELGSFDPAAAADLPATDTAAADYWKKQPGLWVDINAPVADLKRKNPFDPALPMMTYPIFDGTHLKKAVDLTTGTSAAATGSLQLSLNNDGFADIEGFKVEDRYQDGGASMPVKWLYMLKDGTLAPARASGTAGDVEVLVPDDKKLTAQGEFNSVVARIAFWTDDESAKVNINTAAEGTYWDTPVGASQPGKPVYQNRAGGSAWFPSYNATKPAPLTTYVNPYVLDKPKISAGGALTPAAAAGVAFDATDATFEWEYMHMTPGQREYQRYTGHPATTSLSTIFGRQLKLRIAPAIEDPVNGPKLAWQTRAKMCEEIYKMIPRVIGHQYDRTNDPEYIDETKPVESTTYPGVWIPKNYTSKAGTERPKMGEIVGQNPPGSGMAPAPAPSPTATPDADRLYASLDEFLYNPNFKTTATSADQRTAWRLAEPDTTGARDKTREMLEMSSFFLTANSKAPEQNSFNLPRISIWPLRVVSSPNDLKRTAFDKVFAFCSTIRDPANPASDQPFYFTRNNNEAPTGPTDDYQSSVRNQQLMAYLSALTSKTVPGWNLNGATTSHFAAKYAADHQQILAEIFDYIRCTNLCDVSEPTSPGVFPAFYSGDPKITTKSRGYVNPIVISPTARGMGRSFTISEMALKVRRLRDDQAPHPTPTSAALDGTAADGLYQFALFPSLSSVMAGYSVLGTSVRLTFKDIKLKVEALNSTNGVVETYYPFQGITQPTLYCDGYTGSSGFTWSYGSQIGHVSLLRQNGGNTGGGLSSCPPNALFIVKNIRGAPVAATPVKLAISGTFDVEISSPARNTPTNTTSEPVVQTLHFNFPKFTSLLPWSRYLPGPGGPGPHVLGSPAVAQHATPMMTNAAGVPESGCNVFPTSGDGRIGVTEWIAAGQGVSYDIFRQLQPTGHNIQGDVRMIAALADVPDTYFQPCENYRIPIPAATGNTNNDKNRAMAAIHTMTFSSEVGWGTSTSFRGEGYYRFGRIVANMPATAGNDLGTSNRKTQDPPLPSTNPGTGTPDSTTGELANGTPINGVLNYLNLPGDWDRGPFSVYDGALCNKADEGGSAHLGGNYFTPLTAYMGQTAGFTGWMNMEGLQTGGLFSPNRQIASAVMFGSLPTGVIRKQPWQTLLFRPAKYYLPGGDGTAFTPSTGSPYDAVEHPGSAKYGPPDHLLLDLFWMPVVEPYPISEPFATGGKVNLNQQIVPFTNIKRDTALRAVLKSVKIAALNPNQRSSISATGNLYIDESKTTGESYEASHGGGGHGVINRRTIDLDNTLKQISDRLDKNQPFVSASEICDIPLIPKDVPLVTDDSPSPAPMLPMKQHLSAQFSPSTPLSQFESKLATFWAAHKLTGDNLLERPYAAIYPRLTTRSNSYTVHVRVQTLPANVGNKTYILKAAKNQPVGEFRGSYVLDRYLDPNTAGIYDVTDTAYTTKITSNIIPGQHVLGPYRFRVVSSKQFDP